MSDIEDTIDIIMLEIRLREAIRRVHDAGMSIIKYGDRIGGVDEYEIQNSQQIVAHVIKHEEQK